jgi:hypothetical protein
VIGCIAITFGTLTSFAIPKLDGLMLMLLPLLHLLPLDLLLLCEQPLLFVGFCILFLLHGSDETSHSAMILHLLSMIGSV